jgi:L-alanine-DL-glutamate epimerase-like enolase superfamily enzyme
VDSPLFSRSLPNIYVGILLNLPSIPDAEDDRSTCDVLVAEGYDFRDGMYTVPTKPGLSHRIDEAAYAMKCKANEVVVA